MKPVRTKVIAYWCNSMCSPEIGSAVACGPGRTDWLPLLERCYMCCEHVPLEEMLSDDPAECAEFFIRESRKHHWQLRQMQPLGHLDIIAVGEDLYMIRDKLAEDIDDYREIALSNAPDYTLITLKETR